MEADRVSRAHAIFTLALGLERSERASKVAEACGGDAALLARVERLLKAADESDGFLESPALASTPVPPPAMPDAIGTYLVIGVLGVGGMATVYEAVQENPHRRVALKVMHHTMTRTDALLRFRLEAQTLAKLHHPGIAQIYESGTVPLGQTLPSPFFAMELIPSAQTITQYAQQTRMTLRQRLTMFASVCDAVLHGHQNGIIHRDLKPGNILVGPDGQAKVIDFGIARSTRRGETAITGEADSSKLIGTLQWMSPEQCTAPGSIDIRSDVYSLGVVLYELVTGRLPHDLSRCSIPQAVRIIAEEQPTRAAALVKEAAGDLDAIIAAAMHKDREHRYAGAGELAADIRRYLGDLPVEARHASMTDQLRKFARRNPPLAVAIAAAVALLIGGLAVSGSFAYAAARARDAALARERELEVVTSIQESMLSGVDAWAMGDKLRQSVAAALNQETRGDTEHAAEISGLLGRVNFTTLAIRSLNESIVQRYLGSINEQLADQPVLRARLQQRLAGTMRSLGLHTDAEPIARSALATRREQLGPEHEDTITSMTALGDLLSTLGKYDEAMSLLDEARASGTRALGAEHPATLSSLSSIAGVHRRRGELAAAEELWESTLAARRRVLGDDHADTLRTLNNLGLVKAMLGHPEEAERCWRELLERRRRTVGEDHPDYRGSLGNLGMLLLDLGKPAEARGLIEQALASDRRRLGDSHPYTLISMGQYAAVLHETGDLEGAERVQRECVAGRRATLGAEHPDTLKAMVFLATLKQLRGEREGAATTIRECLAIQRTVLGERHPDTLESLATLRDLTMQAGQTDEAIAMGAQLVELVTHAEPARPHDVGRFLSEHGEILCRAGKLDDAKGPLEQGYEKLVGSLGLVHLQTRRAAGRLADYHKAAHAADPTGGHEALEAAWRAKAQPPREEPDRAKAGGVP